MGRNKNVFRAAVFIAITLLVIGCNDFKKDEKGRSIVNEDTFNAVYPDMMDAGLDPDTIIVLGGN